MLSGHFSTAIVANQKFPKGTLFFFLVISQLQDLLWFVFHYLGLEITEPADALDATLSDLAVDMLYSHDLIPQLFWCTLVFIIGKLLFKSTKIGLVASALVAGHFILDLFSGHAHHVFGAESADIALGLYASNVYLALSIEIAFSIGMLWYFFREENKNGIIRTRKNKTAIIGLFAFGILFLISIATTSFRELFGIPEFDLGFNSNIPTLIMTYFGMILFLNYVIPKFRVDKN
jgi:hypothetical protein